MRERRPRCTAQAGTHVWDGVGPVHIDGDALPLVFGLSLGGRSTSRRTADPPTVSGVNNAQQLSSQADVSQEIADITALLSRDDTPQRQPLLNYPPYRSSVLRHPTKDLHHADPESIERWAPCFGPQDVGPLEADLTIQHGGEPLGERITVSGQVVDGDGRPVRRQLVEVWGAS
jgi:protocatechuate 3,4-dioxygenase beta subunit